MEGAVGFPCAPPAPPAPPSWFDRVPSEIVAVILRGQRARVREVCRLFRDTAVVTTRPAMRSLRLERVLHVGVVRAVTSSTAVAIVARRMGAQAFAQLLARHDTVLEVRAHRAADGLCDLTGALAVAPVLADRVHRVHAQDVGAWAAIQKMRNLRGLIVAGGASSPGDPVIMRDARLPLLRYLTIPGRGAVASEALRHFVRNHRDVLREVKCVADIVVDVPTHATLVHAVRVSAESLAGAACIRSLSAQGTIPVMLALPRTLVSLQLREMARADPPGILDALPALPALRHLFLDGRGWTGTMRAWHRVARDLHTVACLSWGGARDSGRWVTFASVTDVRVGVCDMDTLAVAFPRAIKMGVPVEVLKGGGLRCHKFGTCLCGGQRASAQVLDSPRPRRWRT